MNTIEKFARVIEAEASILPFEAKVAVAQCIIDNDLNWNAFTTPASEFSKESLDAATAALCGGARRFTGYKILQFRSFKKYGKLLNHSEPDFDKIYKTMDKDLIYLGKDGEGSWGHFYFGKEKKTVPFKMLVMAGHGRNVDGSFDPGAIGNSYREADLTRELAKIVKLVADKEGIVCDVAPDRNHYSFFKNGGTYDISDYNYVLEIHFNASVVPDYDGEDHKMKGSMFYIDQTEKGHSVEDAILANLYTLGSVQAWDGVVVTQRQWKNGLLVQNEVRRQGVSHAVLETCFISDKNDVDWYQAKKLQIAQAIVKGIKKGFGITQENEPGNQNTSYCGRGIATAEAVESMNVRSAANVDGVYEGIVYTGQRVEVLEKMSNGWLKIVWPGANSGYAFTSNVRGLYYKFV